MVAAESSPALLEANRRLHKLRKKIQADKASVVSPWRFLDKAPGQSTTSYQHSQVSDACALIANFPQHLGWGSVAVTKAVRVSQEIPDEPVTSTGTPDLAWLPEPQPVKEPTSTTGNQQAKSDTVKLYPDLALGMLQRDRAAAGRVWLLLRYLDQEGRGWLPIDFIQEKLTANNSELHVCGRRQFRNLLQQGRGVFWERACPEPAEGDKACPESLPRACRGGRGERVWFKSAAKVAAALGVERLSGHPVQLPIEALLGGIGQVRAHFYASFHSGRRSENPVSRSKLEEITHVPERTQRMYEQTAGVNSQHNIAIGPQYSEKEVQERAWRHGRATFNFIDKEGKQGPAGQNYVAWRLPNSYEGCHEPSPKGRQKKINQQLRELVMKGMRANGREKVERLFWANGAAAGKGYNRNPGIDAYWPHGPRRSSQYILWGVIPGERR